MTQSHTKTEFLLKGTLEFVRGFFFLLFSITACLLSFSCAALTDSCGSDCIGDYLPEEYSWQKEAEGIYYTAYSVPEIPVKFHLVKIDFDEADSSKYEIESFPYTKNQTENSYGVMSLEEFSAEKNMALAINTSPFTKLGNGLCGIIGTHKNGIKFTDESERYACTGFNVNEQGKFRAEIAEHQTKEFTDTHSYVFGGFFMILETGQEKQFNVSYNSRTALGIKEKGNSSQELYILVAEGENKFRSQGLSYQQTAEIFKKLGCDSAIQFDGGGSSNLCIKGVSKLSYKVRRKIPCGFGFRLIQN